MKSSIRNLFIALVLFAGIHQAAAQGTTAFTYQGQLHDGGTNANGSYTMMFKLYDAASSGNQIGSTITTSATLANGLFSVNLDFGNLFNGNARWLDITVQAMTGDTNANTLSPRVQVLPAPYALYSASAASLGSGTWNANVGNLLTDKGIVSNVFGIYANNSLVLAMSTNGSAFNGDLNVKGSLSAAGIGIPKMQVFNTSGTFVVPANESTMMVELWSGGGGGGGSGGGGDNGATVGGDGGGGGGGGYGKDLLSVNPGDTLTVTIGAGGSPGAGGSASGNGVTGGGGSTGGAGGTSSIGTFSVSGGTGGSPGAGGPYTNGNFDGNNNSGAAGVGGAGGNAGGLAVAITGQFGQSGYNFGNVGMGFGGSAANGGFGGNPGGDQSPGGGGSGGKGQIGTGHNGSTGAAGRIVIYY